MNKLFRNRQNSGITLIALVITIIVLIILAGVSINLVFNENGIIQKAKRAAENMELARQEEEEVLANLQSILDNGTASNGGTEDEPQKSEVEQARESGEVLSETESTTITDSNGNLIKVPAGFKIAQDSGINVTEGIVIEDSDVTTDGNGNNRGNQYVWIPVGTGIKKSDGTSVDITLGRYTFASSDGTETLRQDAENYLDAVIIDNNTIIKYIELATSRIGAVDTEDHLNDTNTTALNLKGFIDSVKANGGYYIARYEASYGTDGKANSKVSTGTPETEYGSDYAPTTEGTLWNNITQIDAATASRGLYDTSKVTSDLINSYAWDTAIVYIQEFSGDTDYSIQESICESLTNTGVNGDEVCKINDMALNCVEWTTEYCAYTSTDSSRWAYCCTNRGGNVTYGINRAYHRGYSRAYDLIPEITFRSILYM